MMKIIITPLLVFFLTFGSSGQSFELYLEYNINQEKLESVIEILYNYFDKSEYKNVEYYSSSGASDTGMLEASSLNEDTLMISYVLNKRKSMYLIVCPTYIHAKEERNHPPLFYRKPTGTSLTDIRELMFSEL